MSQRIFRLKILEKKMTGYPLGGGNVGNVMCRKSLKYCWSKDDRCQSYIVEPTWNAKNIPGEYGQTMTREEKRKSCKSLGN